MKEVKMYDIVYTTVDYKASATTPGGETVTEEVAKFTRCVVVEELSDGEAYMLEVIDEPLVITLTPDQFTTVPMCDTHKKGYVVMHTFGEGTCKICNNEFQSPHMPTNDLCDRCAVENNKCAKCGEEL